jgi:hypothetical protein
MTGIEKPEWMVEAERRVLGMTEAQKELRLAELEARRAEVWRRMREHGGIVGLRPGDPKISEWWALTAEKYPLDQERSMILNPGLHFGPVETEAGIMLEAGIDPERGR